MRQLTERIKMGFLEFQDINRRGKDALDKHDDMIRKANGSVKCVEDKAGEDDSCHINIPKKRKQ